VLLLRPVTEVALVAEATATGVLMLLLLLLLVPIPSVQLLLLGIMVLLLVVVVVVVAELVGVLYSYCQVSSLCAVYGQAMDNGCIDGKQLGVYE
jgi:hypothetical protein